MQASRVFQEQREGILSSCIKMNLGCSGSVNLTSDAFTP